MVAYFPTSADGNYFNVNLLRRPASVTQPTVSVAYANGALVYTPTPALQVPANVIDGDDQNFTWQTAAVNPNATATLTVDLGQVTLIGAIRRMFTSLATAPLNVSVRAAQTLGAWTSLVASTPVTVNDLTTPFAATTARYLEFTMTGTGATKLVGLQELMVFPSSQSDPAPSSTSQLDLTYMTGLTFSMNANMQRIGIASRIGAFAGKTVAQGATGDGAVTYDLGNQYTISQIGISFFLQATWPGGGKVEVDDGSGNWTTVFDSGRGTAFGVPDGTQSITFSPRPVRSIRITDYFVSGVGTSTGFLGNIEVY
jgi:hypothetical protein